MSCPYISYNEFDIDQEKSILVPGCINIRASAAILKIKIQNRRIKAFQFQGNALGITFRFIWLIPI